MSKHCGQCGQPIPEESPSQLCPKCCFQALPPVHDELIAGIELGEQIGAGSFGEVFLGLQLDYSMREVAVKILRESGVEKSRFLEEMQILALLTHPNLAQLITSGETRDGRPYYAMEYIEGVPLNESEAPPLATIIQIAEAVAHAQQNGIIHRDLKPNNVLVKENGTVKVIDFGIARIVSGPLAISHAATQNQRLGTLEYMSPEQMDGDPRVDTRTDVYALGLLFYELCLGRSVLSGIVSPENSWSENLKRLRKFEFPKLTPREYDWVAQKACAFDPAERYPNADAFLKDLRAIEKGTMVTAGQKGTLYRLVRFCRKYRATIVVTALVVAFLAGLAAMAYRLAKNEQDSARKIKSTLGELQVAEKETRFAASDARVREANLALERDDAAQALKIVNLALELHPENAEATYLRNFLLATRSFARELPSPELPLQVNAVEARPEGFLVSSADGEEKRIALETRKLVHPASDVRIEDDGRGRLSFSSKETGESLLEPLIYGSGFEEAAVSLAHGVVAATTLEGSLRLWDISKLHPRALTRQVDPPVSWLSFERGKDTLWMVNTTANLYLWPRSKRPTRLTRIRGFENEFFQKVTMDNRRDYLWTFWQGGNQRGLAGGKMQAFRAMLAVDQHTRRHGTSLLFSTMARDEDVVLFADSAGWLGVRNETGSYDFLPEPRKTIRRLALSAKGEVGAALLEDGEVAIFSPAQTSYLARWRPGRELRSLAFTDDGSTLIAAAQDGTLSLHEPHSGKKRFPDIPTPARGLEVMPIPHRQEFLSRSDGDLHIKRWSAEDGKLLQSSLRHRDGVLWFSCSLDGLFLFSIDQKETNPTRSALRIWSLRTGREIVPALEHDSPINCATIYDNGRRIATACEDGTVRRWTVTR